jgi:UDP-galactopyranose mutase
MTRFARDFDVFYWEEPLAADDGVARLDSQREASTGVTVVTPRLPDSLQGKARTEALRELLAGFAANLKNELVRWYYTPMMLAFSDRLKAICTVYDCMDELANFKFAPPELGQLERDLFAAADVVFTGGYSLYEAKQHAHANVHPFPSSVDRAHFAKARSAAREPADMVGLPHPRLGFYGVVDERMDLKLLAAVADAHPDWSLVIVGPVVKINPADLPQRANIVYTGGRSYDELPAYLASWDVALMPFAINESTRFISPTKTPEYLAAGKPVVSTAITDVIRHYGALEGVTVAQDTEGFIEGCEQALVFAAHPERWLPQVDQALSELSWDQTFAQMLAKIDAAIARKRPLAVVAAAPAIWPAKRTRPFDYLIAGAGFSGAVLAERLAAGSGKRVLLIDRRPHIGGNAYDHADAAGILVHRYGPHIFHTNSREIMDYLSRFTDWRPYEHRVLASVDGKLVPMPINRTTLNLLYGANLQSDEQAEAFLAARAEPVSVIRTSADVVISAVGRELYETFFQGYTRKQWGLDPSELDKSVTARVPTRFNTDDRYFTDAFQAMPAQGYTKMFEAMLDHPNIQVMTGVEFDDVQREAVYDKLIYTGPIDEYFDHRFGVLPYRSLTFRHETLDQAQFQSVATVNYPAEATPYTRITEFKHLTGQSHPKTSVVYEYPSAEGDPYYPVPRPENQALFKRYEALGQQTPDVIFAGRLATYRYYNMDQVVGQALSIYRRLAGAGRGKAAEAAANGVLAAG